MGSCAGCIGVKDSRETGGGFKVNRSPKANLQIHNRIKAREGSRGDVRLGSKDNLKDKGNPRSSGQDHLKISISS